MSHIDQSVMMMATLKKSQFNLLSDSSQYAILCVYQYLNEISDSISFQVHHPIDNFCQT
jgi:hypothetical protein